MRLLFLSLLSTTMVYVGCSRTNPTKPQGAGGGAPALTTTAQSSQRAPLVLDHNFGIVPHGEERTHEFDIDLATLGNEYVPLRVHLECSCGRADLRMRKDDGSERFIDGTGQVRNMPTADEKAILHITLDTKKKEASDLPTTVSRGYILLQQLDDLTGMARQRWAFVIRFGIDAPVVLRPFAALDFGRVAQSMTIDRLTTLSGDENHPQMEFLSVKTTDPNLQAQLANHEGHTSLRTQCRPGKLGNHRAQVLVTTSQENYQVVLDATWKVVPDLEAFPLNKISFSTRFDQGQKEGAELRQFVLVTDHNLQRKPEFVVREIVSTGGRDVNSHFAVTVTPIATAKRQQRVEVRYLGGLGDSESDQANANKTFRGKIILTKPQIPSPGELSPTLAIDLVVFSSK